MPGNTEALFTSSAVGVDDALGAAAGDGVWLGDEAVQAPADGVAVAAGDARGARAAGAGLARVGPLHALLLPAHQPVRAVGVDLNK